MLNCTDSHGETIYEFYQWEKGRAIYIDGTGLTKAQYFHFQNNKTLNPIEVRGSISAGIVFATVPDVLLEDNSIIDVFLYEESGGTGTSVGVLHIPVRYRQKPDDHPYVDTLVFGSIGQVLDHINAMIVEADKLKAQIIAENFNYTNMQGNLIGTNMQDAIDELAEQSYVFIHDSV